MATEGADSVLEWVERLGGWAVVVWIVWWLTKRWETQMGDMIKAVGALVVSLDKHSDERSETLTTVRSINQKVDQIDQKLERKCAS